MELVRRLFAAIFVLVAPQVCAQWQPIGPGPAHGGQVEGITNREVVGAVNAIAAHPTDANILYLGAVNGGIWRSSNATAASPTWTRLTDGLGSLSIGSLEFDPTDGTRQTLVAGVARVSSLSRDGGARIGMLRTTNGGTGWSVLTGAGVLAGLDLVGVAARGATLLAATGSGIYRSTDTGGAFALVSGAGGSGLPAGGTTDLAGDPGNNARLYTAVINGTARGIYRSIDTGATWTKVSDATVDAVITAGTGSVRIKIAVGAAGQVFLAIIGPSTNQRLVEVFRSPDGVSGWAALGVPTTTEQNGVLFGAHPGGQGSIHLSIGADGTDSNIVYVGGDRQPYFGEGVSGSVSFFPNSIGAGDYSGRLFRGDAAAAAGLRWTPLTHVGAGGNSAPHADSRDMAIDAQGNLLESDDGGIYKRGTPRTTTGAWVSLNGDMQVAEYHGIAYDSLANRVVGGAQDNGSTQQRDTTAIFDAISTGDGGDPAVEDRGSATLSTRYTSFQGLQVLRRRTVNGANITQSTSFPALTVLAGGPALAAQFYTPLATNDAVTVGDAANAARLLIGADNGVYESLDSGNTITLITPVSPVVRVNAFRGDPIVYGVPGNSGFILLGAGTGVFLRTAASGAPVQVSTLPATVVDVAVDRDAPARLFAMTNSAVFFSTDSGATIPAVTGNLISGFNPGTLRTMAFIPSATDAIVVGTDRGVYIANGPAFNVWSPLASGLPNAVVYELDYDVADQLLVAGTLGRGAWRVSLANTDPIFSNGFEP